MLNGFEVFNFKIVLHLFMVLRWAFRSREGSPLMNKVADFKDQVGKMVKNERPSASINISLTVVPSPRLIHSFVKQIIGPSWFSIFPVASSLEQEASKQFVQSAWYMGIYNSFSRLDFRHHWPGCLFTFHFKPIQFETEE